jgi:hypothetical protein
MQIDFNALDTFMTCVLSTAKKNNNIRYSHHLTQFSFFSHIFHIHTRHLISISIHSQFRMCVYTHTVKHLSEIFIFINYHVLYIFYCCEIINFNTCSSLSLYLCFPLSRYFFMLVCMNLIC